MNSRNIQNSSSKLMLILCIFLILNLFSCIYANSKFTKWTPKEITLEFKKGVSSIFDSENFLTTDHAESIQEIINHIKTEKNYEIFFFIINKMDLSITNSIELFLNDLSYHILNGDEERDHNSIFILFSIGDRQSRIRTGKYIRDILSDSACLELQKEIKTLLRSGKYSEAFHELFDNLKIDLSGRYNFHRLYNKIYNFFEAILIYSIIVVVILIIAHFTKKDYKSAEERLKKIKNICESKKPRREILETTCVICLEPLEIQDCKNTGDDISNSEQNPVVEKIELPGVEKEKLENENLLEEHKNKDEKNLKDENNFVARLECGHSFHSKCIVEWMNKQNKCPICRENIDKEESDEQPTKSQNTTTSTNSQTLNQTLMSLHLFNIQSSIDRNLLDYDINHNTDSLSWNRRIRSSSNSGGSSSWGGSSGGASSSW